MAIEQSGSMEQSSRASPSRAAAKQDSDATSETSSAHSGDPSDRRDADILTQVLSARSEEYRLLFRLPSDEVLVQDFNCALQENILLQGHMYLFIHHVCFYSNIFGFETKKTISFHEVTCVRKAKTAAIFPNAIEIVTGGKKHFFGSFLSRDEAYRLIIDGWAQHSSEAKAILDGQEVKSDANTQDNGLVMLESLRGSKRSTDDSSSPDRDMDVNISEEFKPLSNGNNDINVLKKLEVQENGEAADSLSSGEPLSWQIEDVDAPNIPEYFTMVAEGKFPVCVEDFFRLFVSDRAFEFMQNFHIKCGDKDFRCTPWRNHEQFGHARDISFLHPVKIYIGAKFGHCQEIQKFRVYRNSHLVIETSQQISDVPYGDYFHVEGIWDVKQDDNEVNGCILQVHSNVSFSKKTMFKGKIEQSTRDECREVYGLWVSNALELLKQKSAVQPEGVSGQNTGMVQDNYVGLESSLKLEGPSEKLHQTMTPSKIAHIVSDTKNFNPQTDNPLQENLGYSLSLASIFTSSWTTFVSYLKSQRHFPLFLLVAFAVIVILIQMSIVVLLTRVPEVHLVTQGNYVSSPRSYTSENIEWLEKRFNYLKEEMLMVETRMESMRHEYAVLKGHLQSLERFKRES